jgi:hypothetical protein
LWGSASNSNLEILEKFQSKVLQIITDAPWYVPNAVMKRDKCYRLDKKRETTDKGLTITPTAWQNLYFKAQSSVAGLSAITLHI